MKRAIWLIVATVVAATIIVVGGCGDDDSVGPEPVASDPYALSLLRTDWTLSSLPYQLEGEADQWSRGAIRWHNPPAIARDEVYSDESAAGESSLQPLRLYFRPRGFRYTGGIDDPCGMSTPTKSWGGIVTTEVPKLPGSPGATYLELRAKATKGILHVEFGKINENVDGDSRSDSEDLNHNGTIDVDWQLYPPLDEDVGLDTLPDNREVDGCGLIYDAVSNPDPAGDNWWFEGDGKGAGGNDNQPPISLALWNSPGYQDNVSDPDHRLHYEWINGTEGNVEDPAVQGIPDREDLDGDGLNVVDAYLTFEIPLDLDSTNTVLVPNSGRNGWHTYRVQVDPWESSSEVLSHPAVEIEWDLFTHVRIWFEQPNYGADSLADMDSVWIADWGMVGE